MRWTLDTRYGDYGTRRYYRPSFFGGFSFFPPVIKTLLISNVAVYLFFLFFAPLSIGGVSLGYYVQKFFALYPLGSDFYPWQLFSYMFIHGGFWHLFFNMFALWMFGMEIENTWGSRKFLLFYFVCGVGAGLSTLFLGPLFGPVGPTVGASGSIYGVLIAFAMMFPDRYVFLFPFFVPIKAKYLIAFYIIVEVFNGVTGTSDGIAHFAHLGGAAVGYLYLLVGLRRLPFAGVIDRLSSLWGSEKYRPRPYASSGGSEVTDAKFYDLHGPQEKTKEDLDQQIIDAILDKISVSGYQSLSEDEKRILFEASKKLN
jgi:membrane associated rhomboid family serine protease